MKTIIHALRTTLFSPLAALQALGAPLPIQLKLSALLARLDKPLRAYLLAK